MVKCFIKWLRYLPKETKAGYMIEHLKNKKFEFICKNNNRSVTIDSVIDSEVIKISTYTDTYFPLLVMKVETRENKYYIHGVRFLTTISYVDSDKDIYGLNDLTKEDFEIYWKHPDYKNLAFCRDI